MSCTHELDNIKFNLHKFDYKLILQVVYQNPTFKSRDSENPLTFESEGFLPIISSDKSHMKNNGIHLIGYENNENVTDGRINRRHVFKSFDSNEHRDMYYDKVVAAITNWNSNYPAFVVDNDTTLTYSNITVRIKEYANNSVVIKTESINEAIIDSEFSPIYKALNDIKIVCTDVTSNNDTLSVGVNQISNIQFRSTTSKTRVLNKMKIALAEFSENWIGFHEDPMSLFETVELPKLTYKIASIGSNIYLKYTRVDSNEDFKQYDSTNCSVSLFKRTTMVDFGDTFIYTIKVDKMFSISSSLSFDTVSTKILADMQELNDNHIGFVEDIDTTIPEYNFNDKIKFRMGSYGSMVIFKIIHQSPLFEVGDSYTATNGVVIKSADNPEMKTGNKLFIGGSHEDKTHVPVFKQTSRQDALISKYIFALEEMSTKYTNFLTFDEVSLEYTEDELINLSTILKNEYV